MRAFIAIDLDPPLRQALGRIQDVLREAAPRLRFTAPAAMHLTVKFLGEVDARAIPVVAAGLDEVVRKTPTFEIAIRGLGAFADQRQRVRVVFAGVEDPASRLASLAERIDARLAQDGFAKENRPLHPHLTLARPRQPVRLAALAEMIAAQQDRVIGPLAIERLTLYESVLSSSGPTYHVLSRHPLT